MKCIVLKIMFPSHDIGTCSQYNIFGVKNRTQNYICYMISILFKNTSICKISLKGNMVSHMLTVTISR